MAAVAGDSEFIEAALAESAGGPGVDPAVNGVEGCAFLSGPTFSTNRGTRDQDGEVIQSSSA